MHLAWDFVVTSHPKKPPLPEYFAVWRIAKALGITMFQVADFPVEEPYISQLGYWALICEEAEATARQVIAHKKRQ